MTQKLIFNRRALMIGAGAATLLPVVGCARENASSREGNMDLKPVPLGEGDTDWSAITEEEWRERLTKEQFRILRKEGTEWAGTSELNKESRKGTYICAGCALPIFTSEQRYNSGTGWPSFFDYEEGALGFKTDYKLIYPRKEYHCVRCGGHQGHVFKDGPEPTGLRYCNNGLALNFVPDESQA